jgi:hypothetical protein
MTSKDKKEVAELFASLLAEHTAQAAVPAQNTGHGEVLPVAPSTKTSTPLGDDLGQLYADKPDYHQRRAIGQANYECRKLDDGRIAVIFDPSVPQHRSGYDKVTGKAGGKMNLSVASGWQDIAGYANLAFQLTVGSFRNKE